MDFTNLTRRITSRLGVLLVWGVGIAIVLISVATMGLIWFSRQPAGSRVSVALVNRALRSMSNLELRVERSLLLDHGVRIWGPTLVVADSAGGRYALLRARRLEVETSWWGLVRGQPEGFTIKLDRPTLFVHRDASGRLILPRFKTGPRRPPSLDSRMRLDFTLNHGTVLYASGTAPVETLATDAAFSIGALRQGRIWDLNVSRLSASLPGVGRRLEKADGRARLSAESLYVDRLRVRTDAGWLDARGRGAIAPRIALDGTLSVGEWTWSAIARASRQKVLDVPGGFSGRLSFALRENVITWRDGRFDVLWRGEPLAVQMNGSLAAGALELSDAQIAWRDTRFDGRFATGARTGGYRIEGGLSHVDLSELPRLWPMPALAATDLTGKVVFLGTKGGLDGKVTGAAGNYAGMPFDSLDGRWSLAAGRQTLSAEALVAGGTTQASGTIDAAGLALEMALAGQSARALPLSVWQEVGLDTIPSGRILSARARIQGPSSRPVVRGEARLLEVAYGAVALDSVALTLDGPLGASPDAAFRARSGFSRAGPLVADSALAIGRYRGNRIEVESFTASRQDSALRLSGFAEKDGPDWYVSVDSLRWHGGDQLALQGDGRIVGWLRKDGRLEVDRARVVSSAGAFSARGVWGGESAPTDLTLDLEKLDLAAVLGPLQPEGGLRGTFTGKAHLEGQGRLDWTVDLEGHDLHYGRVDARHMVARGRLADEAWTVEKLEVDTGQGRISFAGVLEWQGGAPMGGSGEEWNDALRRAPRWKGRLVADSLAVSQITEWLPNAGGWRGSLDAEVELNGRPAAPVVSAVGTLHAPGWGQATFDDHRFDLTYQDELLSIRRFAMVGPDSVGPSVTGTIPLRLGWGVDPEERLPDMPMRVSAFARQLDLRLVPLFLPQVAAAGGRGSVSMTIEGTPRKPQVEGRAVIVDGIIRPASREEVLTNVNGTIELKGDRLVIANLTARQGKKGRLEVRPGGTAKLADLGIESYELDVVAREMTAFASGEYVVSIDGTFHVRNGELRSGPIPLPHITGTATVREGVLLMNFADPERSAASQGPAALPPWTYAIDVEAENNLWYRPIDANIEARLEDFSILQEPDRFLMLGRVEAIRGRYYFLGNQFELVSGELFFDAAYPLDPTVSATLTCEKALPLSEGSSRELITLTVSERASKPEVTLTSSPTQLSQSEIVSLLTYGQLTGGAGQIGALGVGYLMRQLTREIPELSQYVGDIEVGSTVAEGTTGGTTSSQTYTTVGVSRYFTRDLLVRYSQVVGDVSQAASVNYQDVTAEYRLNRLFYVSGQVTRRRGVLITGGDETRYDLDLRARFEY